MTLIRKPLTIDGDELKKLAALRNLSEDEAAREAIKNELFADEFIGLLQELHDAGYGVVDDSDLADDE